MANAAILLLDVVGVNTIGQQVEAFLGSDAYQTQPTDSVERQYINRITGNPVFSRRVESILNGRSSGGFGEIDFLNVNEGRADGSGEFDAWLDYSWHGQPVTLRVGDADKAFDDFIVISRKIERLEVVDDLTLRFVIRDRHQDFEKQLITTLIASGPNTDAPEPVSYGSPKNISPVLLDDTAHTYKYHDGAVNSAGVEQVYINGKASAAGFTEDNANGEVDMTAAPAGTLTLDVVGADDGTFYQKPGEIWRQLALRATTDVDALSPAEVDLIVPYNLGLFVRDPLTVGEVLDTILPAAWCYGFPRSGGAKIKLLTEPSADDSLLTLNDGRLIGNVAVVLDPPAWRVTVGAEKNWTVGASTDATIPEDRQAFLEKEHSKKSVVSDATIKDKYPNALDLEFPSLIISTTDSDTEAQRLFDILSVPRKRYAVRAFVDTVFALELFDCITLDIPRFGLNAAPCRVIGIDDHFLDNEVELQLWR